MNLAICEDNPQHYEIICSILRDLPENTFQTCHFSTGNELLETISTSASNCPYSIILMDIDLGENSINGITLADQINKLCPDSQIIFISQYLQYATAVYETEHVYFIHKLQMAKYLPQTCRQTGTISVLFHEFQKLSGTKIRNFISGA